MNSQFTYYIKCLAVYAVGLFVCVQAQSQPYFIHTFNNAKGWPNDAFHECILTNDGGYFCTGITRNTPLYDELIYQKLDSFGNSQWYFTDSLFGDFLYIPSGILEGNSGNIYFTGVKLSSPRLSFLVKVDQTGQVKLALEYDVFNGTSTSNIKYDHGETNFVICGNYLPGNGSNYFVAKMDSNGYILDSAAFGHANAFDNAYDIFLTSDGGYLVAGESDAFAAYNNIFVAKIDSNLQLEWVKDFGGTDWHESGFEFTQTANQDFVICGYKNIHPDTSEAYILKIDKQGNIIFEKYYRHLNNIYPHNIKELPDKSILVGGDVNFYDGSTWINKSFIMRLDSLGNKSFFRYYEILDSINQPYLRNFFLDLVLVKNNEWALSGYTPTGIVEFQNAFVIVCDSCGYTEYDTTSAVFKVDTIIDSVAYFKGVSKSICHQWWDYGDGNTFNGYQSSHQYSDTGWYTICHIAQAANDFDTFYYDVYVPVSPQDTDTVIGLSHTFTDIMKIKVVPNPASDQLVIKWKDYSCIDCRLELYDLSGKLVVKQKLNNNNTSSILDIGEWHTGIYQLVIKEEKEVIYQHRQFIVR